VLTKDLTRLILKLMEDEEKKEVAVNSNDIAWIKQTLSDIKQEVKKTNGRVTNLEMWKANSLGWIAGVASVVTTIVATLVSGLWILAKALVGG